MHVPKLPEGSDSFWDGSKGAGGGEVRLMPRMGAQYSIGIGWHTNFILGIHIYYLAIAICTITGCYGHLVTMLSLFFYQTLGTAHKAWREGW